jgi:hypothetical protein
VGQQHDDTLLVVVAKAVVVDDILLWCDEQQPVARLETAVTAAAAREAVEAGSMTDKVRAAPQ